MAEHKIATFAGGCFWCMEPAFDGKPGVVKTVVGYTGGNVANPTYEDVSLGGTGHVEAIQVTYDPTQIDYPQLLQIFWHNIDPTDAKGQFCDQGQQYRSAIFFHDEAQKEQALSSKHALVTSKKFMQVYTDIRPFTHFYPAEDYHQEYYKKNPVRYKFYRFTCGRDQKLKKLWENNS